VCARTCVCVWGGGGREGGVGQSGPPANLGRGDELQPERTDGVFPWRKMCVEEGEREGEVISTASAHQVREGQMLVEGVVPTLTCQPWLFCDKHTGHCCWVNNPVVQRSNRWGLCS